ncbi:ABC transporter ATP-binding protein [Lysinibacillus xylanilyticus]|uniref:ABC transporter ATP-binding protein n=1 Tax=Lysinibacillus xylanilyticus TaxID=582475 RepID=UPI003819883B
MDIVAKNIGKKYGNIIALENINFNFHPGAIIGVIGHNGSGKTTLLEILGGLREPTEGEFNIKIDRKYKEKLGVVLQENAFYDNAKVDELLELFASFYQKSFDVEKVIETTGISEYRKRKYKDLSGGMKQKVNIALALINDPNIIILDEPTTGLDPLARNSLWEIIKNESKNKIIFISSHYMDEVEENCSHLMFLKKGRIVLLGEIEESLKIENRSLKQIYIEYNDEKSKVVKNG